VREQQEAQMADHQLSWLKDSAQVEEKLEQTLQEFVSQTDKVAEAQKIVLVNSQEHGQLMKGITSDVAEDLESARNTAGAMYEAGEAVRVAEEALSDATDRHKTLFQSLKELMDRAVELGLKSKVEDVEVKMRECGGRLTEGSAAVQQAEIERKLLQDYQKQAQRDREQLQRELGQELPEGDSRQEAVLVMLGRRVEVLKQKLQDMERDHQERLTAALERQKASLEEVAERTLDWRLRDKEREMQQELSYRADGIHREYQSELREQLKRQTDSHNRHLANALDTQAEQLAAKWSGELELKLTEQESHYQKQLALALSRLRGIEYVVNTIAAAGNETKRQQSMRAACDTLHAALKTANASVDPDERFSLQREVEGLRSATRDDPFVLVVLDSLPARAVSPAGIQGEGGLRERFAKVKRMCRRVALVPERGGGMGTYTLSYLQSVLIVSWRFVGRVARSEDEDKDTDKLDTFDVLERADACLRRGDVDLAVRYVNLLRGAPRSVARDWLDDARSYLETLQAVQLVSEYMAALNITSSSTATAAAEQTN
jgi:mitofilin